MTFMNIMANRLKKEFPDAKVTYGNITQADRKRLGLSKSHANDAVAIAAGRKDIRIDPTLETTYYQQVRKKKRSLHEANARKGRSRPNTSAKRNKKNTKSITVGKKGSKRTIRLFDKVRAYGKTGWVTGFTGSCVRVVDKHGEYITKEGASYTQIPGTDVKPLCCNNNWAVGVLTAIGKGSCGMSML